MPLNLTKAPKDELKAFVICDLVGQYDYDIEPMDATRGGRKATFVVSQGTVYLIPYVNMDNEDEAVRMLDNDEYTAVNSPNDLFP